MNTSSQNVLKLIQFEVSDLEIIQRTTLNYLKKYLKETKEDNVINFLRYCTGANMIVETKITIQFTDTTGLMKTPITHTCSSTQLSMEILSNLELKLIICSS